MGGGFSVSGKTLGQGKDNTQESGLTTVADKNGVNSSMGYGGDKGSQSSITKSGINTQNIRITDEDAQIRLTGKTAQQTKTDIYTGTTSETAQQLSGSLNNVFDKEAVQKELDLQRTVSQSFNQNVQAANTEINKHLDDLKAKLDDPKTSAAEKAEIKDKISDWQLGQVLLNSIAAGLTAPTQSGAGIAAATASPALSYKIGQEFKDLANQNQDGKLTASQESAHILAHAVLGAAVAATGGNNALAGAISAGGAEAAAPIISNWLYGETDGSKLTAEQKETVTAITGLLGTAAGATIGNTTADAVQGSLNAQSAVKNNSQLFDDLRDWTKEKAENAATVARELFPNTPAISGFLLGLGDVANGGLGLTDAAAESLAMAIHCIGGLDYCNTATTNNQERGRILLDTAKAVTDGRIKTALEYWGNSLLYGTPEQQRQATEQLARVSTTLGIGSAVSSPRINPLYRPVAVVSNTKVGIQWNAGIGKQGFPWEDYVGKNLPVEARLPKNFKTFDYYDVSTKTAISAKTLDTQTASRLSKPEQIYSTMKGYVDNVANFSGYTLSRRTLSADMIRQREIHLAVPASTGTAQRQQLQRAVEYGRSRNITVRITEIK